MMEVNGKLKMCHILKMADRRVKRMEIWDLSAYVLHL